MLKNVFSWSLKCFVLLFIICLLAVIVCNYIVNRAAKGRTFVDASAVPHRKIALLLGTNPITNKGNPSSYFTHRIDAAVKLYQAGKFDRIILSGATRGEDYDEPAFMRADLMARGVPDSIMELDREGFRTINSVMRAKETFGVDSVIFISQEFHNNRAIYQARHFGVDAIGFNAAESLYRHSRVKNHLREYLARVKVVLELMFK